MKTKIIKIVALCLLTIYAVISWRSDTNNAIQDEYFGYARRYGSRASANAARNVLLAYSKQVHALNTLGHYEQCAAFLRGTKTSVEPVDKAAESEFRKAIFALTKDSNQDPTNSFDSTLAKSISAKVWLKVLEARRQPKDLTIIARLYKSAVPADKKALCELSDDFYLYLLEPKNSTDMLPVARLWLSGMGA
jgi:hypothetical protein